jgi:hypothetical protein
MIPYIRVAPILTKAFASNWAPLICSNISDTRLPRLGIWTD